jgi:AcrR family transcriptional regulator
MSSEAGMTVTPAGEAGSRPGNGVPEGVEPERASGIPEDAEPERGSGIPEDAEPQQGSGISPVVWMLPERPARGPKPAHSRDEIAAAAIKIADADGLDAVTMRRVAAAVGCGTMTLYRYVPTKDHLLDLIADVTAGEIELPALSGDWRADLREIACLQRALLMRHPWLAGLQSSRPSFGPNTLRNVEHGFSILDNLGLTIDEMMIMLNSLMAYVLGVAVGQLAEQEAQRRTGLTAEQWQAWMSPYVRKLMATGQYPMFNRIIADAALPHRENSAEEGFRLGLERILDGIAAGLPADAG